MTDNDANAGPNVLKPTKYSVSLVIINDVGKFLVVRRPDDPDDDIAGLWGFPAASLFAGETEVEAAHRVAASKLGVKVVLSRRIGESTHQRPTFVLNLVDYEAKIVEGVPSAPQSDYSVTQYADVQFSDDPTLLFEIARKGSQCTQIFLEDRGIEWRTDP